MAELPSGTVTFLFTDVEGSTRLWEEHPDAMKAALARHDAILRAAVEAHGGHVVKTTGDGLHGVFPNASGALFAAIDAQRALVSEDWGDAGRLSVRIGIHTGEAEQRDGDYYGPALNQAARLMAAGHGGQVLVSGSTEPLVRQVMPAELSLVDRGAHRLRDLSEPLQIFQLVHADLPATFPPLRTLDTLPGNLPRQPTTFVGRDDEIAMLGDFLRERSVVTLTGVGGVGKTRLAIQVAAELVPEFRDGAWLCELAPVSDPDAVWDTLAASLGVHPSPGRSLKDSVLEYLGPKRLMLVLDNCEHLLDAAAGVVDLIAKTCSGVVVLATSREGLAVAGEQVVPLRSLSLPAANAPFDVLSGAEAVRLFVDRSRDAKPDFALTEQNADAVVQLCRRLDGIPLAIELAAARVRALTPEDLVRRLDQRFKLLTRGSRAALERHQTLRNTIDWSYDLLSETEREALNRVSVFSGGADLVAAEAVVSGGSIDELDVAGVLTQLVDKSLVVVDDDDAGARYRLLESIRQYAQERLEAAGHSAEVRRRHAAHYVALAEAAGPRLRDRHQVAAANEAAREVDNFRAAFDWAVDSSSPEHALRLVAPLAVNGVVIGYAAMDWADAAVDVEGAAAQPLFPVVASWATMGAVFGGEHARAAALVARTEAAEASLGSRQPAACQGMAVEAFFRGDHECARSLAEDWLDRARAADDPYEITHALTLYGATLQWSDEARSLAIAEEAVRIARTHGIASALSIGLTMLAGLIPLDDVARALTLLDEGIAVATNVGDRIAVSNALGTKAMFAARLGEWRTALTASVDAGELMLRLGTLQSVSGPCWAAAVAFVGLGQLECAAVLIAAADARGERWWSPDWGGGLTPATDAAVLEGLGPERAAALREQGAAMTAADAVEYLKSEANRVLGDESA
jgi:predicted ATPase/class 3 adenylate cyclase